MNHRPAGSERSAMTPMRGFVFGLLVGAVGCGTSTRPSGIASPTDDGGFPPIATIDAPDLSPTLRCRGEGVLCDGQTPYQCTPEGTRVDMAPCPNDRPFCAPGLGCLACLPASERCRPDSPELPQRCAQDGSGWLDQTACESSAGQHCTAGRCGDPCVPPEGATQYLGCDYWATATPNSQLSATFPFAVALANPQSYPVTVQLRGGGLSAQRQETLAPGEARAITLPWVDALVQFDRSAPGCGCDAMTSCGASRQARSALVRNGAYQIHATAPVAAYQFNPLTFQATAADGRCINSFTNDASLLLSERALTRRYLVLAAPQFDIFGGFIAVVATSGETTSVRVLLPPASSVAEALNGVVQHDNLTPGDVAVVVGSQPGDLSGAIVEANAPVAVFAGHDCTFIPSGRPACDHLEEQAFPIETLGREYVVADLRDRPLGSVVRIVSPYDTVVRFDPPEVSAPVQLAAQRVYELTIQQSVRVTATRPILVGNYMLGQGENSRGGTPGDPAMALEVPVQQYRDRYDLFVPDTYTTNFLGVVAPHGAHVLIDGEALAGQATRLGPWDVIHAAVAAGRHQLRTAEGVPLGVKVYGTARYTSYMYPGGLDLRLLPPG